MEVRYKSHMENGAPNIPEKLRKLQERSGLSLDKLARSMGYARASSIQRYFNPTEYVGHYLKRDLVAKLEAALIGKGDPPIKRDQIWELAGPEFGGKVQVPQFPTELPDGDGFRQADVTIQTREEMPQDVPVMGTAAGSSVGSFQWENGVIDYVRRPPALLNAKDVYALYVEGDSMWPRFQPGELVFVHPHRPVSVGDWVIVQAWIGEHESVEAYIGELASRTPSMLVIGKFNPKCQIDFERSRIRAVHKVLTLNDLYGV